MYDLCDIRQIIVDLKKFEEQLKQETNVSLNEALCLCQTERGTTEPGALARVLDISPSRLSRILDSLEQRNLIRRSISQTDKRVFTITLTDDGSALLAKLHCTSIAMPHHIEQAIETLHETMQTGDAL